MRDGRRPGWRSGITSVLILLSLGSGTLGFVTEATYSVAVVGSFFWLGIGILFALLAVALLLH
mgnify:CR=1 FL=1